MDGDGLKRRARRIEAMRRRILQAARIGLADLDPADQAELDPAILDCVEEALSDEIGPLIAGLETEAAAIDDASDDAWDDADRHARRMADMTAY